MGTASIFFFFLTMLTVGSYLGIKIQNVVMNVAAIVVINVATIVCAALVCIHFYYGLLDILLEMKGKIKSKTKYKRENDLIDILGEEKYILLLDEQSANFLKGCSKENYQVFKDFEEHNKECLIGRYRFLGERKKKKYSTQKASI